MGRYTKTSVVAVPNSFQYRWRISTQPHSRKARRTKIEGQDQTEGITIQSEDEDQTSIQKSAWSPPIDRVLDDLRTDPFKSYPIEAHQYGAAAIDFWLHIYQPDHLQKSALNPITNVLFPYALQNDVLFEAILVFALSIVPQRRKDAGIIKATRYHRASALARLNQRLVSSDQCASDAVIVSVAMFAAADAMMGDKEHLEANLEGLRQLVQLRGGLESLGLSGYTRAVVLGMEAGETLFVGPRDLSKATMANTSVLTYPTHPFSPHLCSMIAKLPEGLREMALSGRLSTQLVAKLGPGQLVSHSFTRADVVNPAIQQWYLAIINLTKLERTMYLSMYLFKARVVIAEAYKTLAEVILNWDRSVISRFEDEWLLWAATVAASCPDTELFHIDYRAAVLEKVAEPNVRPWPWECIERILQKFYWTPETLMRWQKTWTDFSNRSRTGGLTRRSG